MRGLWSASASLPSGPSGGYRFQEKEGLQSKRKKYDETVHGECQARREPRYWKSEIKGGEDQKIRKHT
eukprot:805368-Pelagomonas_calceolata.AAC.1